MKRWKDEKTSIYIGIGKGIDAAVHTIHRLKIAERGKGKSHLLDFWFNNLFVRYRLDSLRADISLGEFGYKLLTKCVGSTEETFSSSHIKL